MQVSDLLSALRGSAKRAGEAGQGKEEKPGENEISGPVPASA